MKVALLLVPMIVLLGGCSHPPSDTVPLCDVRNAVRGRTADDVSRINIELVFPTSDPIAVTKRTDVNALLEGLQEAVTTKVAYGCSGPRLQVLWKDGRKSPYFYICTTMGPKQAFGEKFTKAYNHVVPADYRVKQK